ncbi:MAG: hypothetical protein ACXQTK_05590, partial [Candidatus Syntropharchaeales archaeon]
MGVIRKNTRYCQFTESRAGNGKAGDITYVVRELQKREELKRFAKLVEIPEAKDNIQIQGY